MAYRHNQDTDGSCSRMGKEAEKRFVSILQEFSFLFEEATLAGQFQHRDFFVGLDASVDVKARKRISRADSQAQDDLIWLELRNGRGHKGWLDGKADWIAFETLAGFTIFPRQALRDWAVSNTDTEKRVKTPSEAVGCLYIRGLAELTLAPINTLEADIPHFKINNYKKEQTNNA